MTEPGIELRTVTVERTFAHAPEKLWRALTQPHLIGEWLMKTDFQPVKGQRFTLRGDWGSVDCEVLVIEPHKSLSYSWAAMGLDSVVTFTLTPTGSGTHLRVDQSGFRPDQDQAFKGAQYGWAQFLGKLDGVLADEG
jgi:uncharacterized protein YndB with AHSA1/START domain